MNISIGELEDSYCSPTESYKWESVGKPEKRPISLSVTGSQPVYKVWLEIMMRRNDLKFFNNISQSLQIKICILNGLIKVSLQQIKTDPHRDTSWWSFRDRAGETLKTATAANMGLGTERCRCNASHCLQKKNFKHRVQVKMWIRARIAYCFFTCLEF